MVKCVRFWVLAYSFGWTKLKSIKCNFIFILDRPYQPSKNSEDASKTVWNRISSSNRSNPLSNQSDLNRFSVKKTVRSIRPEELSVSACTINRNFYLIDRFWSRLSYFTLSNRSDSGGFADLLGDLLFQTSTADLLICYEIFCFKPPIPMRFHPNLLDTIQNLFKTPKLHKITSLP